MGLPCFLAKTRARLRRFAASQPGTSAACSKVWGSLLQAEAVRSRQRFHLLFGWQPVQSGAVMKGEASI